MSLANVLYRMGYESDATAVMQHSLEVHICIIHIHTVCTYVHMIVVCTVYYSTFFMHISFVCR